MKTNYYSEQNLLPVYNFYISGHFLKECIKKFELPCLSSFLKKKFIKLGWYVRSVEEDNKLRSNTFSNILRKELSEKQKRFNELYWTTETKQRHSNIMKETVLRVPESYLNKDIRGSRVRNYDGIDSYGKKCKFNGKWEVIISELLTKEGIKWTKDKLVGEYYWNTNNHLYYVDFYLPELNKYIEVKGYETERDKVKYSICTNLIIFRQKEINQLIKGKITIVEFLS